MRLPAPLPLEFSSEKGLQSEAPFTTTRELMKQQRKHLHSSKSNDIDSRAAFPDSVAPKDRGRARVRPPLSSLRTKHYSAVNAWPMPQHHSTTCTNATLSPRFSMRTGIANKGKASIASLRSDTSLRRTHVLALPHLSGCVFQPPSTCLPLSLIHI